MNLSTNKTYEKTWLVMQVNNNKVKDFIVIQLLIIQYVG